MITAHSIVERGLASSTTGRKRESGNPGSHKKMKTGAAAPKSFFWILNSGI
jgi:hypothetical protein